MKILQITDIHLTAPGHHLFGIDPRARLDACIRDINQHHADADLCVITGDLAHRGEVAAYGSLKSSLEALQVPVKLLLGNHDDRQNFLTVFPESPTDEAGFVQEARWTPVGLFLFLDTNLSGTHEGWYCEKRAIWLMGQLYDANRAPVFVFMHHPPFKIGLPSLDQIGLQQAELFKEAIQQHPNIQHFFCGHMHRPLSGRYCSTSLTVPRGTCHQVWLDFEARDVIPGSLEPPAYAIATIEPDAMVVHFHDFLDQSTKFTMDGDATRPPSQLHQDVA
jgi:3',5'-cyclic AMP phosphodiesterase CpdA